MKKHVVMALGLAWIAVFCLAGSSEAVKFRYENLGTLGGTQNYTGFAFKEAGINNAGQVVGYAFTAGGIKHAFLKSPGQAMVDLGLIIPGSNQSRARGINNSGVIGGFFSTNLTGNNACVWVPSIGGYLWTSLGGNNSEVYGINDTTVVGLAYIGGYSHAYVRPQDGTGQDLGIPPGYIESRATGINQANTIVGYLLDAEGITTACFWSPSGGSYTAAAPLFGATDTTALAINNLGQAVGRHKLSDTDYHAVLKSPGQGLQDLGILTGGPGGQSQAYDLNDSGWVVGWSTYYDGTRAFLWTPGGGMQDLNTLVVNLPPGVRLHEAHAINQRGEIAGYTLNTVFKLTPISSLPYSLLLLD